MVRCVLLFAFCSIGDRVRQLVQVQLLNALPPLPLRHICTLPNLRPNRCPPVRQRHLLATRNSTEEGARSGTPFGWPRDPSPFVHVILDELSKKEEGSGDALSALSGLLFLFLVEGDGGDDEDDSESGKGYEAKGRSNARRPGLSGAYDSRARAAFRAAASAFAVPWNDLPFEPAMPPKSFCSAEAALARYTRIAAQSAKQAVALGSDGSGAGGSSSSSSGGGMTWGRGLAIGAAAVGGAGLLALTGGLALPAVGAGITALFGSTALATGAAAIGTFLAS